MGLAGAAVAHQDQVLSLIQVPPWARSRTMALLREGSVVKSNWSRLLSTGKPGHPQPLLVGVFLPLLGFDFHQGQQEGLVGEVPLGGLPGHLLVMATDGRQPQPFEISLEEQALLHGAAPYRHQQVEVVHPVGPHRRQRLAPGGLAAVR
jgi:hypothetical protein